MQYDFMFFSLQKFEKVYHQQLYDNNVTDTAQFEYAWCLVRSKYPTDVKKGIVLLQELCNKNKNGQRDYIYYLAIGNARIKEYSKALKYCRQVIILLLCKAMQHPHICIVLYF